VLVCPSPGAGKHTTSTSRNSPSTGSVGGGGGRNSLPYITLPTRQSAIWSGTAWTMRRMCFGLSATRTCMNLPVRHKYGSSSFSIGSGSRHAARTSSFNGGRVSLRSFDADSNDDGSHSFWCAFASDQFSFKHSRSILSWAGWHHFEKKASAVLKIDSHRDQKSASQWRLCCHPAKVAIVLSVIALQWGGELGILSLQVRDGVICERNLKTS